MNYELNIWTKLGTIHSSWPSYWVKSVTVTNIMNLKVKSNNKREMESTASVSHSFCFHCMVSGMFSICLKVWPLSSPWAWVIHRRLEGISSCSLRHVITSCILLTLSTMLCRFYIFGMFTVVLGSWHNVWNKKDLHSVPR